MKTSILFGLDHWSSTLMTTAFGMFVGLAQTWADDVIPKAFTADRYAKMAAHSPFTPPAPQAGPVVTATPPPAPGFADKMTATMISQDDSGVYNVMVVDPDSSQHLFLFSDKEDEQTHLQVASVKWPKLNNDEPGARQTPEITLRKGTLTAVVRYEPTGGGSGPLGGAPTGATGMRPFIPGNAGVRPPGAPIIPGNNPGGVAVAPPPPPAPAAQLANGVRRTPIRSFPQPAAPTANLPAAGRPVLPGNTTLSTRPGGAVNVDDDDDDDE